MNTARKNIVYDCSLIELDKHHAAQGNVSIVENCKDIPFEIRRIYYLYDVPGGESRGGHAHRKLQQLILAVGGSFDIVLDDGAVKRTITLNNPYTGLLIVPGIWREIVNFSSGATCLVLASMEYDESDYLRSYQDFLNFRK